MFICCHQFLLGSQTQRRCAENMLLSCARHHCAVQGGLSPCLLWCCEVTGKVTVSLTGGVEA